MSTRQDDEELLSGLREATGQADLESIRRQLQKCLAGNYEVLEPIGQGACGVVFKARDVNLNRIVAVKCPTNPDQQRRLISIFDEARTMAKVNHPNVAAIYALHADTSPPLVVTEFVDGRRIDEAVAELTLEQKLRVFRSVLRGAAELHRRGIVHRDLKPSNILVDTDGRAKILDMGIAEHLPGEQAGSRPGATTTQGTPAYMAPEQSTGGDPHPTADVFSLGIILFELLTAQRPFAAPTAEALVRAIRQSDPPLPRALKADIPGPLQAICLTALEKDPAKRYPTARHFLLDVERFLSGEAVSANPSLLADILDHGIERHLGDLSRWQMDRLISTREHDYFVDRLERLRQREEFWVLDSRRISFSQVVLHLGAWSCIVSAFLMRFFAWEYLARWQRISLPLVVFMVLFALGAHLWRRRTKRVALVLLMAASLTWPLLVATVLVTMKWASGRSGDDLLPRDFLNNSQLIITAGTWFALCLALWHRTKTGAFSLIWGLSAVALATAVFALAGMRTQLEQENFDVVAGWYLIFGVVVLGLAMALDLRWRAAHIAAPQYVIGVAVSLAALTVIAKFGPVTDWLGLTDLSAQPHGEAFERHVKYSFMINGLAYLALGLLGDRCKRSRWLRRLALVLFWLTPSHVLVPILLLEEEWVIAAGWTIPELLLPVGALCFVFASVPKQMKSFFFSGLFYIAVAVQRLTAHHFEDVFAWPIALAVAGFVLAIVAWWRPALFDKARPGKTAQGALRPDDDIGRQ